MTSQFDYKNSSKISAWLNTALVSECQKYKSNPIYSDIVVEFNYAQAWGFIVAGYFLLEQGLKALLHKYKCEIERTHELYKLFERLPDEQKNNLRRHYSDFVRVVPELKQNAPNEIDIFLMNLDGDQSKGSLDWRYYLIEERRDSKLPFVNINLIHEIVYSICAAHRITANTQLRLEMYTYSFRLFQERKKSAHCWYEHRMSLPTWKEAGNRIEKLWGPDYADRCTYVVINEGRVRICFGKISDDLADEFQIYDMRSAFRSIHEKKAIERERNLARLLPQREVNPHRHLIN